MNIRGDTTQMCGLVPQSNDPGVVHELYCFCFWAVFECVAVYRPPEGYSAAENEVLGKMFGGDPSSFERGTYNDLVSAHEAAAQFAQPTSSKEDVEQRPLPTSSKKDVEPRPSRREAVKRPPTPTS
ncbi:hypothetical protein MTO96_028717 [Rhipicephalus appendiculatus]